MGNSKKALIYVRCSTDEQAASGLGLADQEARCRAYLALKGFEVAEVISDAGVSGGKPIGSRPAGRSVLKLTRGRRPKIRHVVALKLDRCFRSAADCLAVTADWNKRGVTLHLVEFGGGSLDLSSAMGRMFLTLAAGFAEWERGLAAERTRAALAVKRSRGEFTGGEPPFGYRVKQGRLVKDRREQRVLREIVSLRDDGLTFEGIAESLNSRGLCHRGSAPWRKGRVHTLWRRAS